MLSTENRVIAVAMVALFCSVVLFAIVETVLGFPGQWGFVVAFVLLALFGAVIPQVYLLRTDHSISSASRMGVVTLVLLVLAAGFSGEVTGTELTVIWGLVGVAIALILTTEVREGYRQAASGEEDRDELT